MTFPPTFLTLHVDIPTFGQDWSLVRLTGTEAVSDLFEFRAVLVAKSPDPHWLALDDHLAQPVHLTLRRQEDRGEVRHIHGIIRHAADLPKTPAGRSVVEWTIAPSVWLLSINRRCRVFQGETAPKILARIFEGFDVVFNLADDYAPHNYCVQYLESDFSFACRLMEESGIYYYFEHDEHGHRLVLADRSRQCPSVRGDDGVVRFNPTIGVANISGSIHDWRRSQSICPARWTSRDHHYELQQPILDASEQTADYVDGDRKRIRFHHGDRLDVHGRQRLQGQSQPMLEVFEYPAGVAHRFDPVAGINGLPTPIEPMYDEHRRRVRHRSEEATAAAFVVEGAGDSVRLIPGAGFRLEGHGPADDHYFITRVEHSIQLPLPEAADEAAEAYANRFRVIPAALPYRPRRRTPLPTMAGSQTAIVVGPPGEEIHTDSQGRIKIQFHWDRDGVRNSGSSCWVRVAQPWSGKYYGFFSLPRVGTEVLVEFEDGDPDQPIVVGCVYNADQPAPFEMPFDRTVTGLKTRTYRGENEDFHGMYFDDANGSEMVRIRSQKDVLLEAKSEVVVAAPNGLTSLANGFHLSMTGGFPFVAGSGSGGAAGPVDASPYSTEELTGVSYLGSGAGGGNATQAGRTNGWLAVSPTMNGTSPFVVSIAAVLGASGGVYVGQRFVYNTPGSSQVWVDPLTLVALASGGIAAGRGKTFATWLLGATGKNEILYASVANITYGGKFEVKRGPDFQKTANSSKAAKFIGMIHGSVVTASSILPFLKSVPTIGSFSAAGTAMGSGLAQILQYVLFQVEQRVGRVAEAKENADNANKRLKEADNRVDIGDHQVAQQQIQQGIGQNANIVQILDANNLNNEPPGSTNTVEGQYKIASTKKTVVINAKKGVNIASETDSVTIGPDLVSITSNLDKEKSSISTLSRHFIVKTPPENGVVYLGAGNFAQGFEDLAKFHENAAFCFQADKSTVRVKRKDGGTTAEVLLDNNGAKLDFKGNCVEVKGDEIKLKVDQSTISVKKDGIQFTAPKITFGANTAVDISGAKLNIKLPQ